MVRVLEVLTVILMFFSLAFSQETAEWLCLDKKMNTSFISEYVTKLIEKYQSEERQLTAEQIPQEDDQLIVYLEKTDDGFDLLINSYTNSGSIELDNKIIELMDPTIVEELIKRKYEWDHLNWKNFTVRGRNAYKYNDFKKIRDHYWWTRYLFEMSPFFYNNSFILRMDPGLMSFQFIQGNEEIGYPSKMSRNLNFSIGSEIVKCYVNLPFSPRNISIGEVHPLEMTTGGGLKFDVNNIGGMISYHYIESLNYDKAYDVDNVIYSNWSGLIYWSGSYEAKSLIPGIKSKNTQSETQLFPPGTQRIKVGPIYTNLKYGSIDSNSVFSLKSETDFSESFGIFFRWEYLSDEMLNLGDFNYYHKWKGFIQLNWAARLGINIGLYHSFGPGFQIGANIAYIDPLTFQWTDDANQNQKYKWEPGFIISPNISLRW